MRKNNRKEGQKTNWRVVVIHEKEGAARETAVIFCDKLVERFWNRCEFNIGWWSLELLGDKAAADQACAKAAEADMVVFSLGERADLSRHVHAWTDAWIRQRGEREGTVVCLSRSVQTCQSALYLRNLAHRAGMDFLTEMPETLVQPMPESLDNYSQRAGQMTSVLDDILHQKSRPAANLGIPVR